MRHIMFPWQIIFLLAIMNIFPTVHCGIRRSNAEKTPSFDGSFDGSHYPPSSPLGAAFKEYTNLPKFPGGTDDMIDFPGTYPGQFAGPFPIPFFAPLPRPFPVTRSVPRIYPAQFFNSFSGFNPYFGNILPFHSHFGGNFPFHGAFPFPSPYPYFGAAPFGPSPYGGAIPFPGSHPFAGGQPFNFPSFRFPPPPLLPPPPASSSPTSSSVVLPASASATMAAAKLIYGIVTRYGHQVLPYPITNPIPLAVPEGARVPVAVNRPVNLKSIKPLHYEEIKPPHFGVDIEHHKGIKHPSVVLASPPASFNSMNYGDIETSDETSRPFTGIETPQFQEIFGPTISPTAVNEIEQSNNRKNVSPDEVGEIIDDLDITQELVEHENNLIDARY